jgi:sulfatase modifying factor 1
MSHSQFDVFISYNRADQSEVLKLAALLRERGLKLWLDVWNLVPGEPWLPAVERALQSSAACAVIVGPHGVGGVQSNEVWAAIEFRLASSHGSLPFRVFPILLPNSTRGNRGLLPTFLTRHVWVEFQKTLDEATPFDFLVRSIHGNPHPQPPMPAATLPSSECPAKAERIPLIDPFPPTWASGYGQDEYGYFAEFSVPTGARYWEFVTQRMRWIPPGKFLMGSPENEVGRPFNERRHDVILTSGYWLADTACTQALWRAVRNDNPSKFPGDLRPVERVSYREIMSFLDKLHEVVPGLIPVLPTEAQWEYACRAGTETPFSFGQTITTDQVNFDGNFPYGNSPQGKSRHETVDVKTLPANPWGLYEMHGNVWEWCADWFAGYSTNMQVDPIGPPKGSYRVIRGGSWENFARFVRSACRGRNDPGVQVNVLGFRLLSSASPVQS